MTAANAADANGYLRRNIGLTLGALGVVFGDIGTSPLYALRECFHASHGSLPLSEANILGVISLIWWGLILVVSVKYLLVVMRADNSGEGGILALMAFALSAVATSKESLRRTVIYLGLFGSALIYGDGVITPAISVLSAVEGLNVATPFFEPYIIPLTIAILLGLFMVQRQGTASLGALFGPIILIWFFTLGLLGLVQLGRTPHVLGALSPHYAISFLRLNGVDNLHVLGSVFLAFTGAEALYADMGHFGRKPIRNGWFAIVLPCLMLNYLGQGALLIADPSAISNPFYRLAPSWFLYPLVVLATLATVIASQALISGAFSLTSQACQLGYLPRVQITHTSSSEAGQIYIPVVNGLLLVSTIAVVFGFRSSGSLAAAYGIAVATTMVITTALVFFVAAYKWRWNKTLLILALVPFFAIDIGFFAANVIKFMRGGWLPLFCAIILFTLMTTWCTGRGLLWSRLREQLVPFVEFFSTLDRSHYATAPGIAVFMIRDPYVAPPALTCNLKYNKVLHERVIFLTFITENVPYASDEGRVHIRDLGQSFYRIIVHHGFMERPDVSKLIAHDCKELFPNNLADVFFFLDRVIPLPTSLPGMAMWRETLFALMMQNSLRATSFYDIPCRQVVEIGFQIEI